MCIPVIFPDHEALPDGMALKQTALAVGGGTEEEWASRDHLANMVWAFRKLKPLIGNVDQGPALIPPCSIGDITVMVHEAVTNPDLYGSLAPLLPSLIGHAWTESDLNDDTVTFQDLRAKSVNLTVAKFDISLFKGTTENVVRGRFQFASPYDSVRRYQVKHGQCGEYKHPPLEARNRKWKILTSDPTFVKLRDQYTTGDLTVLQDLVSKIGSIFKKYALWYQMALFYDCPTPSVDVIQEVHRQRNEVETRLYEIIDVNEFSELDIGIISPTLIRDKVEELMKANILLIIVGVIISFMFGVLYISARSTTENHLARLLAFSVTCLEI